MPFRFLVLLFLLACWGAFAEDQIDQQRFHQLYEMYQARGMRPPQPDRHEKEDMHYVFVSGFSGEYSTDYFVPQMEELRRLGVPDSRIHLIKPSSRKSVEENTRWLYRRMERYPGKLVIVSHSKGSAESVAMAMKHPEFAKERIEGIYCIQGAFGGSPIATALTTAGPLEFPTAHLSSTQRWLLGAARFVANWTVGPLFRKGLESLNRINAKQYWADMMETHKASVPIVSPLVHYITSRTLSNDLARLFDPHYGPNDGVLAVEDQQIKGFGNVVADLTAEHEAFVSDRNSRDVKSKHQRSIMRTIFAAVETRGRAIASLHCPWTSIAAH